jgi:hypothetical protein
MRKVIKKNGKYFSINGRELKKYVIYPTEGKDYNKKWLCFLTDNGITADKIYKQHYTEKKETVYVYDDGNFIEPYALVVFKAERLNKMSAEYPFKLKQTLVFLGEIPNMRSHCIVADYITGKLFCGYHTDDFEVINDV